jgi:hypothetical protein
MFICDWKATKLGVIADSLLIPDMSQFEVAAEQKRSFDMIACLPWCTIWLVRCEAGYVETGEVHLIRFWIGLQRYVSSGQIGDPLPRHQEKYMQTTSFVFKGLNLNSVKQLIFVMVKCGVLFEVRTGFLNNI